MEKLIERKTKTLSLNLLEYYEAVDYMMKHGIDANVKKFFLALNSFGMFKEEVDYLTLALRDSGRVLTFDQNVFEKHSTGGIGDSTSVVIIPLLASLGYKVIKTTAKSFLFTNGSADRFGAIPNFTCSLTDEEISSCLDKTNACVLSHDGDMCPATKIMDEVRIECGIENDTNLFAASIASKKLASGAKTVLVDVKYGEASVLIKYSEARRLAKTLKYLFKENGVKCVVEITDTFQMIGNAVGNAVELIDAIQVLQGKDNFLRKVSAKYSVDLITLSNPKITRQDAYDMVFSALDNGTAYNQFLKIIEAQKGDKEKMENMRMFIPYLSVNFMASKSGNVGYINSLLLGELIRKLCENSHDNNIGAIVYAKVGDEVRKGDILMTLYYKDQEDFDKYREAIENCIKITNVKLKNKTILKKVVK